MGLLQKFVNFIRSPLGQAHNVPDRAGTDRAGTLLHNRYNETDKNRHWVSIDVNEIIPRMGQIFNDLYKDTDLVLEEAGQEGLDFIYANPEVERNMTDLGLAVALSRWKFAAKTEDQKKLVPFLTDLFLDAPGFQAMTSDMVYALIENVRMHYMIWNPVEMDDHFEFQPASFIAKEKWQFAPATPDWSEMYLVDNGYTNDPTLGVRSGFKKRVERKNFILGIWRNREIKNGWGNGIGAHLYRLALINDRLQQIFVRSIEVQGGGVRTVEIDPDAIEGKTAAQQNTFMASLMTAVRRAMSFDSIPMPVGTKLNVVFPPAGAIETIQKAIQSYYDNMIAKLISGTSQTSDTTGSAPVSTGQSRALSNSERMRRQYLANWVAETLNRDYISRGVELNSWIFRKAGVSPKTKIPPLVASVRGGHDRLEEAQILATIRVPVLKREAYDRLEYTEPSEEQIKNGEVYDPLEGQFTLQPSGTKNQLDRTEGPAKSEQEDRAAQKNLSRSIAT